jgi:hypothetical protein
MLALALLDLRSKLRETTPTTGLKYLRAFIFAASTSRLKKMSAHPLLSKAYITYVNENRYSVLENFTCQCAREVN